MRIISIVIFGIVFMMFSSCNKDADEYSNYFEVTIEGKKYFDNAVLTGMGYSTSIGSIEGFENFITTLYTPYGDLEAYFLHYDNASDFEPVPGSYKIAKNESDSNYKDKSLLLNLSSSITEFYLLSPDGVNNITSIKEIASNNSDISYLIEGSFNCTFTKGESTLPITGKYQFKIEIKNR